MNILLLRRLAAGVAAVLLVSSVGVKADEVTIGGVTHKDVLVYKGASVYYIKIPKDGRVINIPAKDLDASSVVISDDPYERDTLKAKFEDMKAKRDEAIREGGGTLPADSPFNTAIAGESQSYDTAALLGNRGGGKSMGIPRAILMQVLGGAGVTFEAPSGNSVSGKTADGNMTVELQGPEANLTGMVFAVTLPQAQAPMVIQGMAGQMAGFVPWIGEFLTAERANLMQGKTVERTQDGRYLSISPKPNGANITITITIRGA